MAAGIRFIPEPHITNRRIHYYRQSSAPSGSEVQVGDIWVDTTSTPVIKVCTSTSPITFAEEATTPHNLFSASHADVDETDTPADLEYLRYDNASSKWKASKLLLPKSTSPTGLDEAEIWWDSDDFKIIVGDGADIHFFLEAEAFGADATVNTDGDVSINDISILTTRGDIITRSATTAQRLALGADGEVLKSDGTDAVWEDDDAGIAFVIDGGGSAITTGVKGDLEIPFPCEIEAVRLLADQSGSIQIDIWKDSYANYPPTDADSITASAVPAISSSTKYEDSTLTGWTTSISKGDILRFNVDSATTIQRVTLILSVRKT